MAGISFEELIAYVNLPADKLDKQCSDEHITSISLFLPSWQAVAPHLGLTETDEEEVNEEGKKIQDKRYRILRTWKAKNLFKATYRVLVDVFLKIGRADLADKVCRLLVDKGSLDEPRPKPPAPTMSCPTATHKDDTNTHHNVKYNIDPNCCQFVKLICKLRKILGGDPEALDCMKLSLMTLKGYDESIAIDPKVYHGANTVQEFFESMSKYWNCCADYDLLTMVIGATGNEEANKELNRFLQSKDSEMVIPVTKCSSSADLVVSQQPQLTAPDPELSEGTEDLEQLHNHSRSLELPPNRVPLIVEVSLDHMTCGMYDTLKDVVASVIRTPREALSLVGILEGSCILIWHVSEGIAAGIKRIQLSPDDDYTLSQCAIVMMSCGDDFLFNQSGGETPLIWATLHGQPAIVSLLLGSGANVNAQDKGGETPLIWASYHGHLPIVNLLLGSGANVNAQDKEGWTPLIGASHHGCVNSVCLLLANQANVNAQMKDGVCALHKASQKGHHEVVQLLIESGANVNIQDEFGVCALHMASQNGHHEVVQLLIESGANVNIQDEDGWSSLMCASQDNHVEVVKTLIEAGAIVNTQDEGQVTALMVASYNGSVEVVKQLLSSGAAVDMQDQEGRTALALASWEGHLSVVQVLVARGIDPNIQDQEGLTALIIAIKRGHTEVVQVLVNDAKADVNIQEKSTGWSALFFAAKEGDLNLTRILIQAGADVWLKDKNEVTALDVAKVVSQEEVCEELRKWIGSQRHGQQEPSKEVKNQVASAGKILQALFREVEKRVLRSRTLKREMLMEGKEIPYSSHGSSRGVPISTHSLKHKKAWYKT